MILDKFKGNEQAVKLTRDVDAQQMQIADEEIAANALHCQIGGEKEKLESAAVESDRKAYDKIARTIADLQTELDIKFLAIAARRKKLTAAKEALYVARSAERVRTAAELGKRRDKLAASVAEHIQGLHKAHAGLHELGREIMETFPELATKHRGCAVAPNEITGALEIELARVSSPGTLPSTNAAPALPGSEQAITGGNPANAEPLTQVIAKANALLVRRVSAQAVREPAQSKPQPAKVEADPDDAILQAPALATVNAADVMASMPRRKLT